MPAAVLTAAIAADLAQKDGRRWIEELFTDQYGVAYPRFYLCAAGFNAAAQLPLDQAQLVIDLQNSEIGTNINAVTTLGSLANPTTNYSTPAQNFAALRVVYQTVTQTQAIFIGDFLNTLTDVQLENAFGLTQTQVTNLRSNKLQPAATLATSIRSAVGQ
jgi:hypothetical protein